MKPELTSSEDLNEVKTLAEKLLRDIQVEYVRKIFFASGYRHPELIDSGYYYVSNVNILGLLAEEKIIQDLLNRDPHRLKMRDYVLYEGTVYRDKILSYLNSLENHDSYPKIIDRFIVYQGKKVGPFKSDRQRELVQELMLRPMQRITLKDLTILTQNIKDDRHEAEKQNKNITRYHQTVKDYVKEINKKIKKAGLSDKFFVVSSDKAYSLIIFK